MKWTFNNFFKKETHFWEKKVVDGDLDGRIQAKVRTKSKNSSVQESCRSMKASIQNLIQEFTAVVFENNELEFRGMSELKSLLPLLASQDSNTDVDFKYFQKLRNEESASGKNYRYWHLDGKKK